MKFFKGVIMLFLVAFLVLYSGLVLPTTTSLMILVMALVMDSVTTYRCLKIGGKETNPIVRFLFGKIGFFPTTVLWYVVWYFIITYRFLPAGPEMMTAVAFAYWVVPISNMRVLKRLRSKQRAAEEAAK